MRWRFWQQEQVEHDPDLMEWEPTGPLKTALNPRAAQSPASPDSSSTWTTTQVIQLGLGIGALYASYKGYKRFLRRIPNIDHVKPNVYRKRSMYGYVTRVGDGDNFRFYHTPCGRFAGWGWLPGRIPQQLTKPELVDNTLHVRVAGVDAPECAHFGRKEQPFGPEAMAWLGDTVEGRYVRVWPHSRDRFDRIVSTVAVRLPWRLWRSDLGLRMIQSGCATVYEAKTGSEFGGKEEQYREAEKQARNRKVGMWKQAGIVGKILGQTTEVETPRAYKTRMNKEESGK